MNQTLKSTLGTLALVGAVGAGLTFAGKIWRERDDAERGDTGAVVVEGEVDAFSVRVGDCFLDPGSDGFASVKAAPCADPHDFQAYHLFNLTGDTWPGDIAIDEQAEAGCVAQVPVHIDDGILYVGWLKPTIESWAEANDREIVCTLARSDGTQLTGSLIPGS